MVVPFLSLYLISQFRSDFSQLPLAPSPRRRRWRVDHGAAIWLPRDGAAQEIAGPIFVGLSWLAVRRVRIREQPDRRGGAERRRPLQARVDRAVRGGEGPPA